MTTVTRTLCLCCGSYYDLDEDCPEVEFRPHSIQLSLEVSRRLLTAGIAHPDQHDVREVLRELGYR